MDETTTHEIRLSARTYELLRGRAVEVNCSPEDLADEVLGHYLSPPHAYVELVQARSGLRAMVRGTRVPVSAIVGYIRLGETPETISADVLPRLTLAQIYDALSYYYEHQAEVDDELAENTEEASMMRLREKLGNADFRRLTGQTA